VWRKEGAANDLDAMRHVQFVLTMPSTQEAWDWHWPQTQERMMEFKRKKSRGQSRRIQKTWLSSEGYRIVWRKEIHGISVPARFQATVRIVIPNYSGIEGVSFEMWDFTDLTHRIFKTRKAAEDSCEKHRGLWTKATEATGFRSLLEIFGKLPTGFPLWVRKKLNRKVYEVLMRPQHAKYRDEEEEESCSSPPAPPKTSVTLPTDTIGADERTAGPVLHATDEDGTTIRQTRHARSKATETSDNSDAPTVTEPAKGQKKPAAKRTRRQSTSTTKGRKRTTGSSKSAKPHSRVSRKNKSTSSGS
jgi:hypothetical protein